MQKRQLMLILACIATTLAIVLLAILMIPGRSVHYVSSATLQRHFFLNNGWYYDGRDWVFVQGGHKVTGTRQINGVTYHFARDGKQVLPYRVSYQYQLSGTQGSNQAAASKYIILHDVGSRANGRQAASFMRQTANSNQAYTNFIVGDGGTVYQ
ncbi:MAG: N-acetylmuramoyl-L-alanine amidase, partial [Limosilactobacillus sp.]